MKQSKWVLLILLSFILAQTYFTCPISCANTSSTADDWPMFHHDANHSGYTDNQDTTNSATLLWSYTAGSSIWSSPVVAQGLVIFGSRDGYVYCLDTSNGKLEWNYTDNRVVDYSSVTVNDGHVYFGSIDGSLICLDLDTGMHLWNVNLGGAVWSSPLILNSCIYIGCSDGNLYCLDASNGTTIWKYTTPKSIASAPAIANGIVYFSSENYFVYAINATTGTEVWHTFAATGDNTPTLYNGCLYTGSNDGIVFCLNASTGAVIWKYTTAGWVVSCPAVAYGCVYVGSEDNNMYCLNASDGEKIWQTATGYWICSSAAVSGGNVYVGSQDQNIYCFDAFTGGIKWSYSTGAAINSSPAVVGDTLYIGSDDGSIYALALCNATENNPPPHATSSLTASNIVFDTLSCAAFVGVILVFAFFIKSKRQLQTIEGNMQNQKSPWYKAHSDLICVLAILAFSTLLFVNLSNSPLWAADEQTYSQWAYHMIKTGDYLTPWNFGVVSLWVSKPPLFMWLISLAYQVFGATNFAARFVSALFGSLSLVLIFYLGKKLYNRYVGLLAALVLGTFSLFYTFATHAMTDVTLVFFILASIYFLVLSEDQKNSIRYAALSGLFFGLALMTKQTSGLLIPIIAVIFLILAKRSITFLFSKRFALFFGVAALIFVPWLVYMSFNFGKDFWNTYFLYSTFGRVFDTIEGHVGGYFFYFDYLLRNENLLWIILLPFSVALCIFNVVKKRSKPDGLILVWIVIVLGLFSVSQTKIYWYILPVYPAFALAIGSFVYQLVKKILSKKPQENGG